MSECHHLIDYLLSAELSAFELATMPVAIIDGLREKTPAVIVFISNRADFIIYVDRPI